MRSMLYVLGQFRDTDLDWIAGAGHPSTIPAGATLLEEGKPLDAVFIVLSGRLTVRVRAERDREIAQLGAGEIVGHLSLLDSLPPRTTVSAVDEARVFVLPHDLLRPKLSRDEGFAARFYRAIALYLAHWVNQAVIEVGEEGPPSLLDGIHDRDEILPEVLENLSLAGARFVTFLEQIGER